jgi:hypothetical protein
MTAISHAEAAAFPRWVGWRNVTRNGRATKAPFAADGSGAAKADDPATWAARPAAEAWARRNLNGAGGGIGLQLGAVPERPGVSIGGVDLDACRDPETGQVLPWAEEIVAALRSYTEVSPSGAGAKVFFTYATAGLAELRAAMGTEHGRGFKRGKGEHPPAVELYVSNRYFAWTGRHLDGTPRDLRPVALETLLWLVREAGPAFAGTGARSGAAECGASDAGADALAVRLRAAMEGDAGLARRWNGDTSGLKDGSRSALAFALGAAIKRHGFGYAEMCELLHRNPRTAEWTATKGEADGGRELRRIWDKAGDAAEAGPGEWLEPNMAVLRRSATEPPPLPLDCFGPWWARWLSAAAQGANAPPDFAALPLLAVASAPIGNARWALVWKGWAEPPALWCASVGNPSSGKSPGAAPVARDALARVEATMARDHPAALAAWEAQAAYAAEAAKEWQKGMAAAAKAEEGPRPKPEAATCPPRPVRPRAKVSDATIEKLADLLAGLPKGVVHVRDELSGWLLNLSRYSGGTDRPFWLEAYNGGPYQVDRQKHPEPVFIPHLTVPIFGTIQPDRLGECLEGADDGLAGRFLWAWPEPLRFARPAAAADADAAAERLLRLERLRMPNDDAGRPRPSYVPFSGEAAAVAADFAGDVQAREDAAHGLMRTALGKARGQMVRLALVLEWLWWSTEAPDAPEPREVGGDAARAAAGLMDAYFLPMAARVLGDASIPDEERHARTLAEWIVATRPERVNVSAIRDGARLPGLRESEPVKAACRYLAEAGWLREPPRDAARPGRPRGDWLVNPALAGGGGGRA